MQMTEASMKLPMLTLAAVALSVIPVTTRSTQFPDRAFTQGGSVRLNLAAAAYRIRGDAEDRIRIRWNTSKAGMKDRIHADVEVKGTRAVIWTIAPHNSGAHFDIDLPSRSDLDVDLNAGDLEVRNIEGNKNLSMWAGDVTIDVGKAELYRRVEASVRFGEISAPPFNRSTGGIFRSLSWSGSGKYTVRAKLFAGDLKLR
jgi:hypothetical protein